ncbi:MAG: hypothetical protein K2M06_04560, partial [Muribaculaceae bacterium]|nr:hypothetical protein [Muribaculaceae bacterium]
MNSARTLLRHLPQAYALLIALLTAVGLWLFPIVGDDLNSIHCVRDAFLSVESTQLRAADFSLVDLAEVWRNIIFIFTHDHFRLPNLLMPLVILLPRWVPAAISGAALYYIITRGAAMAGSKFRGSSAVWMALVMVVIFPWNDQLYLTSFQAPYLWDAALALWLGRRLLLLRRPLPAPAMFFAGFVAAFGQEAFGVALTGGAIVCAAFDSRLRTRANGAAVAGMALGIFAVLLPSLMCRHWFRWTFFSTRSMMWIPYAAFALAYPLVLLLRRKRCTTPEMFMAVCAVLSALLTAYFRTGARVCCFGVIAAGIGFGSLIFRRSPRPYVHVLLLLTAILLPAHLAATATACMHAGADTRRAVAQYKAAPDALIFSDLTPRQKAPWYLLQKPYYDWMYHDKPAKLFAIVYGAPEHMPLRILPSALRDFRWDEATPIEGDAGLVAYKGLIVGPSPGTINLLLDFGKGPVATRMHIIDFIADGDTTTYRWYYPNQATTAHILTPVPLRANNHFHYVP